MPSPPRSTLFPYTTLFRSTPSVVGKSADSVIPVTYALAAPSSASTGPTSRDRKSTRLNSSHLGISYAVSTKIYTLSLHDALPIYAQRGGKIGGLGNPGHVRVGRPVQRQHRADIPRSEEHTSELQSLRHLVCRLHQDLHSFPTRRSSDLRPAWWENRRTR